MPTSVLLSVDTDPSKAASGFRSLARSLNDTATAMDRVVSSESGLTKGLDAIAAAAERVGKAAGPMAVAVRESASAFAALNKAIRDTAGMLDQVAASGEQVHIRMSGINQEARNNAIVIDELGRRYRDLATSMRLPNVRLPQAPTGGGAGTPGTSGQGNGQDDNNGGGRSYSMAANFLKYQVGYAAISDVSQAIKQGFTDAMSTNRTLYSTQATTDIGPSGRAALQTYVSRTGSQQNTDAFPNGQPYTPNQLATGLYPIASAGQTTPGAIEAINNLAVKFSAFTMSPDPQAASQAIISTMNAYGVAQSQQAKQAPAFFDVITNMVNKGAAQPQDVAAATATFGAPASAAGLPFGQAAGVFASLTLATGSAQQAAQDTASLIRSINNPSVTQKEYARDLGVSNLFGPDVFKHMSMPEWLNQFYQHTQYGLNLDTQKLGGTVDSTNALRFLLGKGGEQLANTQGIIKSVGERGTTDKSYGNYEQSDAAKFDNSTAAFHASVQTFAAAAAPLATALTLDAAKAVSGTQSLFGGLGLPGGNIWDSFRGSVATIVRAGVYASDDLSKNKVPNIGDDLTRAARDQAREMVGEAGLPKKPADIVLPQQAPPAAQVTLAPVVTDPNVHNLFGGQYAPAPYNPTMAVGAIPPPPPPPLTDDRSAINASSIAAHRVRVGLAQDAAQQRFFDADQAHAGRDDSGPLGIQEATGMSAQQIANRRAASLARGMGAMEQPDIARLNLAMAQGQSRQNIISDLGLASQSIANNKAIDPYTRQLQEQQLSNQVRDYLNGNTLSQKAQDRVVGLQGRGDLISQRIQTAQTQGASPEDIAKLNVEFLNNQQQIFNTLYANNKGKLQAATQNINAQLAVVGRGLQGTLGDQQVTNFQQDLSYEQSIGASPDVQLQTTRDMLAARRQQVLDTEFGTDKDRYNPNSKGNQDLRGIYLEGQAAQQNTTVADAQLRAQSAAAALQNTQALGFDPATQRAAEATYVKQQQAAINAMPKGPTRDLAKSGLQYQQQQFGQNLTGGSLQQNVNFAAQALQQAQASGASPDTIAKLENAYVDSQIAFYRGTMKDQSLIQRYVDAANTGRTGFLAQNVDLPKAQLAESAAQQRFSLDQQTGASPATLRRDENAVLRTERDRINAQYSTPDSRKGGQYALAMKGVEDQQKVFDYNTNQAAAQLMVTAAQNNLTAAQQMNMLPDDLKAANDVYLAALKRALLLEPKSPARDAALANVDLQGKVNQHADTQGNFDIMIRQLNDQLRIDTAHNNTAAEAVDRTKITDAYAQNTALTHETPLDIAARRAEDFAASLATTQPTPAPYATNQRGIPANVAGLDSTAVQFGGTQSGESRRIAELERLLAASQAENKTLLTRIAVATERNAQAGSNNALNGNGHERRTVR